ncbi:Peroxin/Dysferlin domain-containing protein [Boletus edulis BED1]|uniref:Peroxin/Dysferlin domain-containing protein n=1 Tax=Boletus edulis BED1 TaxID=1328754 RepID=A0AAD4BVT6_BOLED|nr:Peroxin/Dysferlin domain-containing protein [Boletus edulis BED1]
MTPVVDFVSATPPSLTLLLVPLAPLIHHARHLTDILSWTAHWEESVLLLALWWSLCLFADLTLRFFLPVAVLFVFALRHWSDPTASGPTPPATEAVLHALVDDLAALNALLPDPSLPVPSLTLVRIAAVLYLPYLVLTYLVPLPICIAISGTLLIIHRARWARNARAALARSAHLRWAFYHFASLLSGTPLPTPLTPPPEYASRPVSGATDYSSAHSHTDDDPSAPRPSPPLRFLYTVYENQRWWVGLDWTAALLPGERPSWCSASQLPLPPPSTFSLPSPTISFVPVGKHGRAKRMARWTWEEPEWRVVVRKEGQGGLWRIEKAPPKDTPDDTGTAARMLRAARGSSTSESPERDKKQLADLADSSIIPAHEDDIVTDPEGWAYGDNKWEGANSKGGMGKYTRYRRWTRIAVLTETVELVGPGEFGVLRDSGAFSTFTASSGNTASMVTAGVVSPTASSFSDWESTGSAPEQSKEQKEARGMLRQRLKAAMDSGH